MRGWVYVTRIFVAEVVPGAFPLAILIPSTFNLHKYDDVYNILHNRTNH